jgi:alginate O-acetyltransferase complex protein AlgI
MLFNAPEFIFLFLPIAVAIFFALHRLGQHTLARIWLVVASLSFYGFWNARYVLLIGGSIVFNYEVGWFLVRAPSAAGRRWWVGFGVLANLILLGYFKYADFLIGTLNGLSGSALSLLETALPLGISFFTFQQIAYLVDTYRSEERHHDFINYVLFVTFFPHLIAGPLVHHQTMIPQFDHPRSRSVDLGNLSSGLFLFALGLFKKVGLADTFATWAVAGFEQPLSLGTVAAWITSLSYTLQLYFDFSGYSDMAVGIALMFNIALPINFNSPYQARDIQDFWRRWHMTLSQWLRDYVYIPLGGNRVSAPRHHVNLFATFVIGGLWHGAGWTFVIWGALHGAAIVVHTIWRRLGLALPGYLAWGTTLLFVNAAWVFFRAKTAPDALHILATMTRWNGRALALPSPEAILPTFALGAAIALFLPNSFQIVGILPYDGRWRFERGLAAAGFVGCTLFYVVVAQVQNSVNQFLYFNF